MSRSNSVKSNHRSTRSSSSRPQSEDSDAGHFIASRPELTRSSTARPSTDTNTSEHRPFLSSTHSHTTGEQIWSTSHPQGSQRAEIKNSRGVIQPRASVDDQANWRSVVQSIIGYLFRDIDLLEEALESPGSGVTCVGKSHRHFLNGNTGLAKVGEMVMTTILREQCYLLRIVEGDAVKIVDNIVDRLNLNKLGIKSKLQQFIRPRLGVRPSQKHNVLALLKADIRRAAAGADTSRQVASGVMAIIGAVYFDGGIESSKRVMTSLGLIIKLPEPKPAPGPL